MNLTKWSYTRRYNIKAYFDKFPHSNVVFRPINYFYFVYIVNWSKEDPVVTRADLEEMEKLLNKELGTGNAYAQRKSQTESISLNESAKGVVLKRAMVIANPSSGRERAEQYINEINRQLTEVYDEIDIRLTEKEGDARRLAEEACQRKIDTVVSVGGDGTLNEIINGLAEKEYRPSLGVIPLGTVNDFARALGIPLKAEQAIHLIKEKVKKQVDIGKLNDHYFLNIVALGGIAEATAEVSTEMKTTLGSLAYLLEGMKSLRAKTPFSLEIETEGGRWKGEAFLFLAALTNSVGGFEKLAPEAEPDDGKLHCFIINELNLPQLFLIIPALLRGELKEHSKVQFFRTDKVRIHSLEPLKANMDGEEGDEVPLDIQVLPSHLEIFVPGEEDRDKTKLKGNGGM